MNHHHYHHHDPSLSAGSSAASLIRAETFQRHWQQLRDIATIQVGQSVSRMPILNIGAKLGKRKALEASFGYSFFGSASPDDVGSARSGSRAELNV